MRGRLAAVASVAILASACGSGGGGSTSDAAELVPPDALAYLTVDSDLSSSQLKSAQSILDKFPIKNRLLASIRSSLQKQGLSPGALTSSAGPQVDVAVLKVNGETNAVGFTQPKDAKTFDAQLDQHKTVHTTMSGWTVFADKQSFLDAVKKRSGKLSDEAAFQAAMKTIPAAGDAILRIYGSTAGARTALGAATANLGSAGSSFSSFGAAKWLAAALTSQDGSLKLEAHAKSSSSVAKTATGLSNEIPSGSILALSLTGGATVSAQTRRQLQGLTAQLGFDLGALVDALNGPVIAYVRAGLPLPDVTIAARPANPQQAVTAIGKLIARFGRGLAAPVPTKIDGGTLNKVDLGSLALYYGVSAGQLVVTDSANALAELKGSVGHLTDDGVFKEAKDGAGLGDTNQGFLFVDLKDALPAIEGFAQLANQKIPPSVDANVKPLRSLLVFGSRDGDVQSLVAYLKTS